MSWINEDGPIKDVVLSSRIRLARNIANMPFPSVMEANNCEKVIEKVRSSIMDSNSTLKSEFDFLRLNDISEIERYILVEKHLASLDLIEKPNLSAILLDRKEWISIMINEEDHIRMQCIMPGYQLEQAWEILSRIDDVIEESIEYSYDESLGYLTCCPTNVGTGMRASIMMHLPALVMTGHINTVFHTISKIGLTVRGLYGEGSEGLGNIFQISNQVTLGSSEEEIIHNLNITTRQIIEKERMARKALIESGGIGFQDKIWRAFGLLTHARTIDIKEFMTLLSQVRLGVAMGIIPHIGTILINELMILSQPAHLQSMEGKELPGDDLDKIRADNIRSNISSIS